MGSVDPTIVIGLVNVRRAHRLIPLIEELPLVLGGVGGTMDEVHEVLSTVTVKGLILGAPDHTLFRDRAVELIEGRPVPALGVLESNGRAPAEVWRWMERTNSRVCNGSLLDRQDAGATRTLRDLLKFFCRASTPTRDLKSMSIMNLDDVLADIDDL